MTENNNIENLFKDTLSNYEAPVDASLWQGIEQVVSQPPIAASVVANTEVVVKSFSVIKLFVAAAIVSVVGVASYFVFDKKEVKPSSKIETNADLSNNSGAVSVTVTQPTPEKIVVKEAKPVSATKKQSSPEIFSAIASHKENTTITEVSVPPTLPISASAENSVAPKPLETNFKPADVGKPYPDAKQETTTVKAGPPAEANTLIEEKENSNTKKAETIYPFPGQETQSFTPNGDGKNDVFRVADEQMQTVSVKIISVSGKLVYLRDKIGESWDGTLQNGKEAPEGLYIVFINGVGVDGKTYSRTTRLMLVRN